MQSTVFVLFPRSGVLQAYNITAFTFTQGRCRPRDKRASLPLLWSYVGSMYKSGGLFRFLFSVVF
jgi:hypothetical protein